MARSVMRTVLVISREGENPDEIIKKYSEELEVEPYLFMKRKDAAKSKENLLNLLKTILQNKDINLSEYQKEVYKDMYWATKNIDDDFYFKEKTAGCTYDENGDAYSTKNPNAYFKYPKCYQSRLEKTGEEAEFSNPFPLKNGGKAYQAHYNDIDWSKLHGYNKYIYDAAWELCVNDKEPENETEETIKERMSNRLQYFAQFKDKENYVNHSTSFFTYGIATSDFYKEVDYTISDMDWVANFYDTYIKPIKDNPLISLYEVRCLSDN